MGPGEARLLWRPPGLLDSRWPRPHVRCGCETGSTAYTNARSETSRERSLLASSRSRIVRERDRVETSVRLLKRHVGKDWPALN